MSAVTVVSSPASLIQRRRTPTKKFTQTCGLNPRQLPMRRPHQPKSPERAQRRSLRSRRSLMSVQEVVGLAVEGGAPGGRGGVGPAFRRVGVALEGPSNLSRALLSSQSGWCTRYGRSAGTSRVSPEGLLGVDSGNQLSVVCGPGVRARGVDVRPTGGGRHRAVRYQGTWRRLCPVPAIASSLLGTPLPSRCCSLPVSGRGQSLGLLVRERWPPLALHVCSVTLVVSSSLQPQGL